MAAPYSGSVNISFQSKRKSYKQSVFIQIKPNEFNLSYNPTLIDESGSLYPAVSGSNFRPYATSIGLYDDDQNLLAVAKLAQPVMISHLIDMVFQVNLGW